MLIFGTIERTKYLGQVADRCAVCDDVQPFGIHEIFAVTHLSFIPLGMGTLTGATRRCLTCQTRGSCETDAYSSILTDREARSLSLEDLLRRTNPELLRLRQQDHLWKECLGRPLEGDDTVPPRPALETLRALSADSRVSQFLDRLLSWHQLPSSDRYQLLVEIDAYVNRHEMRDRALDLVMVLAQNAPDGAGCGSAMVVGVLGVVLLPLCALGINILDLPPDLQGSAFFYVMIATGVLAVIAFEWSRRATYWRLFTDKLIEPLEAAGIDVGLVLKALDFLQQVKGQRNEVRVMLRFRPLLTELLRARGMISSTDEGPR
jgi:hypothetical protein